VEAPKPPDIAIEQARQRAERERQEREREERDQRQRREREQREQREREQREQQRTAAAERERERAQAAATERAREAQLRRITEAAGPAGASPAGTAARDAAPSASYVARLAALIRSNLIFSGDVPGNPAAEVEVRTGAGGTILSRRLVKSSGNAAWDEAVLRAIDRTNKLPPDTDGRVPSALLIAFRPKE
jgi:colicin import membrane protein